MLFLWYVYNWQENLVESKHHKLARSLRSGVSDKDAKPNASVRDLLNTIVAYPPTKQLTTEEQDLVWKFRFYLSNQKKVSTKCWVQGVCEHLQGRCLVVISVMCFSGSRMYQMISLKTCHKLRSIYIIKVFHLQQMHFVSAL